MNIHNLEATFLDNSQEKENEFSLTGLTETELSRLKTLSKNNFDFLSFGIQIEFIDGELLYVSGARLECTFRSFFTAWSISEGFNDSNYNKTHFKQLLDFLNLKPGLQEYNVFFPLCIGLNYNLAIFTMYQNHGYFYDFGYEKTLSFYLKDLHYYVIKNCEFLINETDLLDRMYSIPEYVYLTELKYTHLLRTYREQEISFSFIEYETKKEQERIYKNKILRQKQSIIKFQALQIVYLQTDSIDFLNYLLIEREIDAAFSRQIALPESDESNDEFEPEVYVNESESSEEEKIALDFGNFQFAQEEKESENDEKSEKNDTLGEDNEFFSRFNQDDENLNDETDWELPFDPTIFMQNEDIRKKQQAEDLFAAFQSAPKVDIYDIGTLYHNQDQEEEKEEIERKKRYTIDLDEESYDYEDAPTNGEEDFLFDMLTVRNNPINFPDWFDSILLRKFSIEQIKKMRHVFVQYEPDPILLKFIDEDSGEPDDLGIITFLRQIVFYYENWLDLLVEDEDLIPIQIDNFHFGVSSFTVQVLKNLKCFFNLSKSLTVTKVLPYISTVDLTGKLKNSVIIQSNNLISSAEYEFLNNPKTRISPKFSDDNFPNLTYISKLEKQPTQIEFHKEIITGTRKLVDYQGLHHTLINRESDQAPTWIKFQTKFLDQEFYSISIPLMFMPFKDLFFSNPGYYQHLGAIILVQNNYKRLIKKPKDIRKFIKDKQKEIVKEFRPKKFAKITLADYVDFRNISVTEPFHEMNERLSSIQTKINFSTFQKCGADLEFNYIIFDTNLFIKSPDIFPSFYQTIFFPRVIIFEILDNLKKFHDLSFLTRVFNYNKLIVIEDYTEFLKTKGDRNIVKNLQELDIIDETLFITEDYKFFKNDKDLNMCTSLDIALKFFGGKKIKKTSSVIFSIVDEKLYSNSSLSFAPLEEEREFIPEFEKQSYDLRIPKLSGEVNLTFKYDNFSTDTVLLESLKNYKDKQNFVVTEEFLTHLTFEDLKFDIEVNLDEKRKQMRNAGMEENSEDKDEFYYFKDSTANINALLKNHLAEKEDGLVYFKFFNEYKPFEKIKERGKKTFQLSNYNSRKVDLIRNYFENINFKKSVNHPFEFVKAKMTSQIGLSLNETVNNFLDNDQEFNFYRNLSILFRALAFNFQKHIKKPIFINSGLFNMGLILYPGSTVKKLFENRQYRLIFASEEHFNLQFANLRKFSNGSNYIYITKQFTSSIEQIMYRAELFSNLKVLDIAKDFTKFHIIYWLCFWHSKVTKGLFSFFKYYNNISVSKLSKLPGLIDKYLSKNNYNRQIQYLFLEDIYKVMKSSLKFKEGIFHSILGETQNLHQTLIENNIYSFPLQHVTNRFHELKSSIKLISSSSLKNYEHCHEKVNYEFVNPNLPKIKKKTGEKKKEFNLNMVNLGLEEYMKRIKICDYSEQIYQLMIDEFDSTFKTTTKGYLNNYKSKNIINCVKMFVKFTKIFREDSFHYVEGSLKREDTVLNILSFIIFLLDHNDEELMNYCSVSFKEQNDIEAREIYVQEIKLKAAHYIFACIYGVFDQMSPDEFVTKSEDSRFNQIINNTNNFNCISIPGDMAKWSFDDNKFKFKIMTEMLYKKKLIGEQIMLLADKAFNTIENHYILFDSKMAPFADPSKMTTINEKVFFKYRIFGWEQGLMHNASSFVHLLDSLCFRRLLQLKFPSVKSAIEKVHSDDKLTLINFLKTFKIDLEICKEILDLQEVCNLCFCLSNSSSKVSLNFTYLDENKLIMTEFLSVYNLAGTLINPYLRQAANILNSFTHNNFIDNHMALITRCCKIFSLSNDLILSEKIYYYYFNLLLEFFMINRDKNLIDNLDKHIIRYGGVKTVSIYEINRLGLTADNYNKYKYQDKSIIYFECTQLFRVKKNHRSKIRKELQESFKEYLIEKVDLIKKDKYTIKAAIELQKLMRWESGAFENPSALKLVNFYKRDFEKVFYFKDSDKLLDLKELQASPNRNFAYKLDEFIFRDNETYDTLIKLEEQAYDIAFHDNFYSGIMHIQSFSSEFKFQAQFNDIKDLIDFGTDYLQLNFNSIKTVNKAILDLKNFKLNFNLVYKDQFYAIQNYYEILQNLFSNSKATRYLFVSEFNFLNCNLTPKPSKQIEALDDKENIIKAMNYRTDAREKKKQFYRDLSTLFIRIKDEKLTIMRFETLFREFLSIFFKTLEKEDLLKMDFFILTLYSAITKDYSVLNLLNGFQWIKDQDFEFGILGYFQNGLCTTKYIVDGQICYYRGKISQSHKNYITNFENLKLVKITGLIEQKLRSKLNDFDKALSVINSENSYVNDFQIQLISNKLFMIFKTNSGEYKLQLPLKNLSKKYQSYLIKIKRTKEHISITRNEKIESDLEIPEIFEFSLTNKDVTEKTAQFIYDNIGSYCDVCFSHDNQDNCKFLKRTTDLSFCKEKYEFSNDQHSFFTKSGISSGTCKGDEIFGNKQTFDDLVLLHEAVYEFSADFEDLTLRKYFLPRLVTTILVKDIELKDIELIERDKIVFFKDGNREVIANLDAYDIDEFDLKSLSDEDQLKIDKAIENLKKTKFLKESFTKLKLKDVVTAFKDDFHLYFLKVGKTLYYKATHIMIRPNMEKLKLNKFLGVKDNNLLYEEFKKQKIDLEKHNIDSALIEEEASQQISPLEENEYFEFSRNIDIDLLQPSRHKLWFSRLKDSGNSNRATELGKKYIKFFGPEAIRFEEFLRIGTIPSHLTEIHTSRGFNYLNGYKVTDTDFFCHNLIVEEVTFPINIEIMDNAINCILKFDDYKKTLFKTKKLTRPPSEDQEFLDSVRFRNSCWLYLQYLPKRFKKYLTADAIKTNRNRLNTVVDNISMNPLIQRKYDSNFEFSYNQFLKLYAGITVNNNLSIQF